MSNKYLLRLDDACPTMRHDRWQRMIDILNRYEIHPMVGVIPHNENPEISCDLFDKHFWEKVCIWEQQGWTIALHGYNHIYITQDGLKGLNPMWARSEFAGATLDLQCEKIRNGINIFREHGLNPKYFFAPSHTYDENTLQALRLESDIRIISDTIATRPYKYGDFIMIPQAGGHCRDISFPGVWTFCLHPASMTDVQFLSVEKFLEKHSNQFISFADLNLTNLENKDWIGKTLSWAYFSYRKLRGIS